MSVIRFMALIIALLWSLSAAAETIITGGAHVRDADTVVVGNVVVRLKGVDAAELSSSRGQHARDVMLSIINGGTLRCVLTGEKTWRREVGYCITPDGTDIGQAIVESGAALGCPRYDRRYVKFEQATALQQQVRAIYCMRR